MWSTTSIKTEQFVDLKIFCRMKKKSRRWPRYRDPAPKRTRTWAPNLMQTVPMGFSSIDIPWSSPCGRPGFEPRHGVWDSELCIISETHCELTPANIYNIDKTKLITCLEWIRNLKKKYIHYSCKLIIQSKVIEEYSTCWDFNTPFNIKLRENKVSKQKAEAQEYEERIHYNQGARLQWNRLYPSL